MFGDAGGLHRVRRLASIVLDGGLLRAPQGVE
jgi:hypothetical protein